MWYLDHKEDQCRRTDTFEWWCWRKLLRVPWTARRSIQSMLKEPALNIQQKALEGLMPKLKLQYFGTWCKEPTHWKRPWCWETLRPGREGDDRRWNLWMASPIQRILIWANSRRYWRTGKSGVLQSMGSQSWTQFSNSTTTTTTSLLIQLGTTFSIHLELSLTKSHTHI